MNGSNKNSNGMDQNTSFNPIPSQGPVVGIIIVLIVLIVGGFYFFSHLSALNMTVPAEDATTTDAAFAPTGNSDDPVAIQNDLDAESFDEIDAEMNQLNAEFGY